MANYVTTAELNTYLGTSGEDTLIDELNGIATAYINNFLRVTTLNASVDQEEEQEYTGDNEYMMKELNPSNLTLVNGAAVVGEYKFIGRKLVFEHAPVNADTTFNRITFTYNYGYSTITDDIKSVVYQIVGYFYNSRKASGIESFTQGQITINYDDTQAVQKILDGAAGVGLKKYIKNDIIC